MASRLHLLGRAAESFAPRAVSLAPQLSATAVQRSLHQALAGAGPLPPAVDAAEKQLAEQGGRRDKAVGEVIENHLALAAVGGFVTNLGGVVTMSVLTPTNIAELALLQSRMVAGIAHLHGHDVDAAHVRIAILATLLGEHQVRSLLAQGTLPAAPGPLAAGEVTGTEADTTRLNDTIARAVATELLSRVAGKRLTTLVARRVPLLGGGVGAGSDAWGTWRLGRYADREFRRRNR